MLCAWLCPAMGRVMCPVVRCCGGINFLLIVIIITYVKFGILNELLCSDYFVHTHTHTQLTIISSPNNKN